MINTPTEHAMTTLRAICANKAVDAELRVSIALLLGGASGQQVDRQYYTLAEAADAARCSVRTLRNRRYLGLSPRSVTVARRVVFPAQEFDEWLRSSAADTSRGPDA